MIVATVDYSQLAAITTLRNIEAIISPPKIAAIVELQDAQGWKSINETPRYVAHVEKVEITALDVYTLIVDEINISDNVVLSDQVVFRMNKVIDDNIVVVELVAFSVIKPFSDNAVVGEDVAFQMNKPFSDDITTSDSTTLSMNKAISDNVPATDFVVFDLLEGETGFLNGAAINETAINVQKSKVFSA